MSVLTVCVAPVIVTVDVPFVNTDPAPEVSHDPDTVHDPDVRTIVPDVPPVMLTLRTVIVASFALTVPPLLIVRSFEPNANVPTLPVMSVSVPVTETAPAAVIVPVVTLNVVFAPIVTAPTVNEDVVPVIPPVPARDTAAPPVSTQPEVVKVPDPDVARVPDTSMALFRPIVPVIVRL